MDYQSLLDDIAAQIRPLLGQAGGKVASYIPALARVSSLHFGIALRTCDGQEAAAGDCDLPFSIQSMSKVFSLTLAMRGLGDALWERIGREPSAALSIRWCSWRPSAASRATPSSTPAPLPWPTGCSAWRRQGATAGAAGQPVRRAHRDG